MLSKSLPTLRTVFVCVLSLLASTSLAQTTINVGPGQTYTTIQSGINAAVNGDTVLVAPGTYYENIDFKGKAITVTSSGGAAQTIIDGGANIGSATVNFQSGETRSSVISNMTIRNGGSATFAVRPNLSGGVYAFQSAPTILNNIITGNTCNGVVNDTSAALIEGNTISATIGETTGNCLLDKGDAVLVFGYSLSFGTGIVPTVQGNLIENNVQGIYGETGGVYLWSGDHTVIEGNAFHGNIGTTAGDVVSYNTNIVSILQNLMYDNRGGEAGAISLLAPDASVGPFIGIIAGNTIADNTVTYGNTYAGDSLSSQVFLSGNLAQYVVVNNIIVNNAANTVALNCDVDYSDLAITPLVFDHNDIYGGPGGSYGGSCPSQTGEYGNISQDPEFTNSAGGDYTLRSGSPAIDTGNNSAPEMPSNDLAGNPRIQDATALGYPVVDMGAYELSGRQETPATVLTLTPSEYFESTSPYYSQTPLTFTSTLTSTAGVPTGPVTVFVDGAKSTVIQVGSTGTETYSLPGIPPGLHAFTSSYPGSGIFPPAVSVKFYLIFPKVATTLALTSSPNPSDLGSPVTFTVTAGATDSSVPSPISLTDTSTNTVLTSLTPNSAGVATYTTSALSVGYHTITATFAGSSSYESSLASVLQEVINGSATNTTLTCSPASILVGSSALLNATVTSSNGVPTGTISFAADGAPLGTQNLVSGAASLSYTGLLAGIHLLTATYTPTGGFAGSSASCSEVVTALPSTSVLTVTPTSATFGSPVMLTATVSPTTPPGPSAPSGTVTMFNGTTPLYTGPLSSGGVVSFSTSGLPGGIDNLTCQYNGSFIYAASSCNTVPVTINAAASALKLSASSNPVPTLNTITFKGQLTLNGQPAGAGYAIAFSFYGQTFQLTTDAAGAFAFNTGTATLLPGSYPVVASFAGSNSLLASSASLNEVITADPTSTSVQIAPSPAYVGQLVTISASVLSTGPAQFSSITTGTVTFFDGSTSLGTQQVMGAGTATFTTSRLAVGTHAITAVFAPASTVFFPSTSPAVNEVILPSGFTIAMSPATITIAAGASGTAAIELTSVGNFAGPLALTYGTLPTYATASISPASVTLTAAGTGAAAITLNTLLKSANDVPARPGRRTLPVVFAALILLVVPLGRARRHRVFRLLSLLLLVVGLQGVTACTNDWYVANSVAPGTHQLAITATDVNHNSQTANLTVIVTP